MTSTDDTLLSTRDAATVAGVQPTTIRQWRHLGRITPADTDPDGYPRYALPDVVAAEISCRGRGRPRHTEVVNRYARDVDWPLDHIRGLVARCSAVMRDIDEDLSLTRLAIARLGVRGSPEGSPVADLRAWSNQFDDTGLRCAIVDLATTEISEREAGALRPRRIRRRHPVVSPS